MPWQRPHWTSCEVDGDRPGARRVLEAVTARLVQQDESAAIDGLV